MATLPKSHHQKKSRKKCGNVGPGKPPPGGGPDRVATSRAERMFRLRTVEEAMIAGKRASAVQEALAKVGRVVKARTVHDYIQAVRLKWEEEDRVFSPYTRARQLRDLHATAEAMKGARAWSSWVATQKLIADLEGNFPEEGGVTDGAGAGDFQGWTQAELDAFIASGGEVEPGWIKAARQAAGAPGGNGQDHDEDAGGMPTPSDILH